MVHSLAENYGWSYGEIMKITMPQMILMSHASAVAYEKMMAKSGKKDKYKSMSSDEVIVRGKKLSELNSEELANYYLLNNEENGFGNINVIG